MLFEDMARAALKSDVVAYNAVPCSEDARSLPCVEMGPYGTCHSIV